MKYIFFNQIYIWQANHVKFECDIQLLMSVLMIVKNEENMMTSSNGNIFHITGLMCREFTGYQWIPLNW